VSKLELSTCEGEGRIVRAYSEVNENPSHQPEKADVQRTRKKLVNVFALRIFSFLSNFSANKLKTL